MSKLSEKTSVSALSSSAGNICENCKNEVDEELKTVKKKKGRKRIEEKYCKACFTEYMGRSSQFTLTMPNSLIIWLDEFVSEQKAEGKDYTQSSAIRRGLELLKEKQDNN